MVHKFTLFIQYEAYAIRILLVLASLRNYLLLLVNCIQSTSCYKICKTWAVCNALGQWLQNIFLYVLKNSNAY